MIGNVIQSVAFFLVGLLYLGLGVPLVLQKVAPNSWYGFRTAKTLSDSSLWYEANRIAGIDLVIAGAALALAAVVIGVVARRCPASYVALTNITLHVVVLLIATLHSYLEIHRL